MRTKLGAAFFISLLSAAAILALALHSLKITRQIDMTVTSEYAQDLIDVSHLRADAEAGVAAARGFLITSDTHFLERLRLARASFLFDLALMRKTTDSPTENQDLADIAEADQRYNESLEKTIAARGMGADLGKLLPQFEGAVQADRDLLENKIQEYAHYVGVRLQEAKNDANGAAHANFHALLFISVIALFLAGMTGFFITRTVAKLYEQATEAVRLREEIVEIVSHDLKNPLSSIMLTTDFIGHMARSGPLSGADLSKRLSVIQRAAERMRSLIYGILDLSKMKSGNFALEISRCEIPVIVTELEDLYRPLARERGIALTFEAGPGLAPFYGDHERVIQVLSNLIGNALKFTPQGGSVRVSVTDARQAVEFSVRDNGPGIAPDDLTHIFDRYWRGQKSRKDSSGLGLAIAQGIVAAHHGEIRVESRLGAGSTFIISIPKNLQAAARPQVAAAIPHSPPV